MFEKYTDRARRTVTLAQEEAKDSGYKEVEPWHILYALAEENESVAAIVLRELGFEHRAWSLCYQAERGDQRASYVRGFSAESKRVFDFATQEALALNHNYIGTEHLLLGLARVVISSYLCWGDLVWWTRTDLSTEKTRKAVLAKLDSYKTPPKVTNGAGGSAAGWAGTSTQVFSTPTSDKSLSIAFDTLRRGDRITITRADGTERLKLDII